VELTVQVNVPSSPPRTAQGSPASYARSVERIGKAGIREESWPLGNG